MKLTFDPMIAMRACAVIEVNKYVSNAASNPHIEAAHRAKLEAANSFKSGNAPAPILVQEAEIRGISVDELADLIISKADGKLDALSEREIYRQRVLQMIADAKSPQEITEILREHGGKKSPINMVTGQEAASIDGSLSPGS